MKFIPILKKADGLIVRMIRAEFSLVDTGPKGRIRKSSSGGYFDNMVMYVHPCEIFTSIGSTRY